LKRTAKHIGLLGCLAAALILCLPWTLLGKNPQLDRVRRYVPETPVKEPDLDEWTFSADRVSGDHTSEYVEAFGNCTLALGDNQLRADFARYYQATGWVFLKGNVRAQWGGDFLQADEGEFDLNTMTGWLKNGRLFMAKPHVYVEAERVAKTVGDTYTFKNAKVTACDGEKPAWSVTSEEGEVQIDGRVKLYRSAFRIKDVPVFYWPYMSLPGRKARQSGFLPPSISSSDKLGMQVNLPYYWVISDEADATFYQNFMSRRGYMQGFEFRHSEDSATKGVWQVDALKDNIRAVSEADEWKDYRGDGMARPNRSRWWVRSKYDGWLGSTDLKVKLDLDVVSDQNYLRDFQKGPNGYDSVSQEFLDTFGRDIDKKDSATRTSVAYASRSWDRFGATGALTYVENLAFMNGNGRDQDNTTVQTLPELNLFGFQQQIPGTPLEVSADAKYDYFTRNMGDTGHRVRLTPEVKLPVKTDYVTFIPSLSGDLTSYDLTRREGYGNQTVVDDGGRTQYIDTNATKSGFQARNSWGAGFSAFSEMTRVFTLSDEVRPDPGLAGTSKWTRLKHSVVPRVEYGYTPTITGQDELPYFDRFDRIQGRNEVTYSLTNVLDRRRDTVVLSPGSGEEPQVSTVSDYLDFLLFRVEQSYDRKEATRNDELAVYKRRPYSDLMTEVVVKPENFIDLVSRVWFSPYKTSLTQNENYVRLHQDGLGEITLGYDYLVKIDEYKRYRDNTMSIVSLGAKWELNDTLTLNAKYRHDFNSERDLERTLGLSWAADCYIMHVSVTQKSSDTRFEIGFDLFNF